MRRFVGSVALAAAIVMPAPGQDVAAVERQIEALRTQLRDVTEKQARLQSREQQLDEDLKPENVEHSLSGVGTTDAAALRDRRRQQLERERASVEDQLQSLAASRSRLEASIASAEAEAVRLRASALGANNATRQTDYAAGSSSSSAVASPSQSNRAARPANRRRRKRVRRRTR